jgi:hypothetical protein
MNKNSIVRFCKWFENSLSGVVDEKIPQALLEVAKELANKTLYQLPTPTLFSEAEKYINGLSVCIENKIFVQDVFYDFSELCLGYKVIFDDKTVIAVRDYGAVVNMETGSIHRKLEFIKDGMFHLSLQD